MEFNKLSHIKDREAYFVNISLKASENCIKDYDSREISDEEKECLKSSALKLHFVVNDSRLERWALNPTKRPYEEYYWKYSKHA